MRYEGGNKEAILYIKPLSVNQVWQGKRYKTKTYLQYEKHLWALMPDIEVPETNLKLTIKAGFSSKNSDLDNIAKPLIDVMQKRYSFNDRRIYKLEMEKEIVKKGSEYIQIKIEEY